MSSLLEKAKKVVMDEEVENEEGYDDFNYEEYSVPEEPSTPPKRRLPILIDNNGIATIENCLFAVIVAVAVPWVFPFILELYSLLLQTEFAVAMSNVAKGWVLITQAVSVFLALKFNKTNAYIFMLSVLVGLFVMELAIFLLLLIPIW